MTALALLSRRDGVLRILLCVLACACALTLTACADGPCDADAPSWFGRESRDAWCDIKAQIDAHKLMGIGAGLGQAEISGNPSDVIDCFDFDDFAHALAASERSAIVDRIILLKGYDWNRLTRRERRFWDDLLDRLTPHSAPHSMLRCTTPEEAVQAYLDAHGLDLHYIGACATATAEEYRYRGRSYCTGDVPPEMVRADFPSLTLREYERLLAFADFPSDVWPRGFFQLVPRDGGWQVRELWGYGDVLPRPMPPARDEPSRPPSLPVG
jgi:hypothetical protein